jgi:hypothetical protein
MGVQGGFLGEVEFTWEGCMGLRVSALFRHGIEMRGSLRESSQQKRTEEAGQG